MTGRDRSPDLSAGIVVVGAGIMGLSAAWHLAESGADVLLVEQQPEAGRIGSSHGATRGLRYSYEDPTYARLAMHAETWWRYAERRSGLSLLHMTGGLDIGDPAAPTFARTLRTVRDLGLDHELLDGAQTGVRFPQFALADRLQAIFQPGAGLIAADRALDAFARLAEESGTRLLYDTEVTRIDAGCPLRLGCRSSGGDLTVACDRLVICAGPWTNEIIDRLSGFDRMPGRLPLSILQCEPVHIRGNADALPDVLFYRHPDPAEAPFTDGIYVQPQPADFLGDSDAAGGAGQRPGEGRIKVGRHGGLLLGSPREVVTGRPVEDLAALIARVDVLPGFAGGAVVGTDTCFYTMTPSEGFILDFLDPDSRLFVAGGFSGHGFKFAPVIGRAIAELLLDGRTEYEVRSMEIGRVD